MSYVETAGGLQVKRLYDSKSQINSLFEEYNQNEDYLKLMSSSFRKVHATCRQRLSRQEQQNIKHLALWRSIRDFNCNAGCSFKTYLVNNVRYEYFIYCNGRPKEDMPHIVYDVMDENEPDTLRVDVQDLIDRLPEKMQCVVRMRYYDKRSLKEIAGHLNCSNEWVRILLAKALDKMRQHAA